MDSFFCAAASENKYKAGVIDTIKGEMTAIQLPDETWVASPTKPPVRGKYH